MTPRLVVLTEIIAPYRIPVFNALARRSDLDLHVIFMAETYSRLRQWRVYKDEINFSYQVLPSWRWQLGKHSVLLNRGLRAALEKANPQVIICGGYNYPASWQALLWARRKHVEFILWSESNIQDARPGWSSIESLKGFFLRRSDRSVVPGKNSAEYLRAMGSDHATIYTAPNAIDNDWFAAQAENVRADAVQFREKLKLPSRFILFVGRLVPEKGVFDLLQAYAKLESSVRSQVSLVFAGDGVSKSELVEEAKRISPGTVCFPGFAQREDLAAFYAFADTLVLPTHSDPWGLVVNEAMACGLPIIVTAVAGCAADLVEDGWNGFVVPPSDIEKLRMAIESLLADSDRRAWMSVNSLDRIKNFSPEKCAEGLAASALATHAEAR